MLFRSGHHVDAGAGIGLRDVTDLRACTGGAADAGNVMFRKVWIVGLLVAGLIFHNEMYTVFTFVLTAVFMLLFILFKNKLPGLHLTTFFISYAITLIPFLVVNGLLTALPVVQYNDQENLGIRIYTIPLEDVFYGMLLIFLNVLIFEWLRTRTKKA